MSKLTCVNGQPEQQVFTTLAKGSQKIVHMREGHETGSVCNGAYVFIHYIPCHKSKMYSDPI